MLHLKPFLNSQDIFLSANKWNFKPCGKNLFKYSVQCTKKNKTSQKFYDCNL